MMKNLPAPLIAEDVDISGLDGFMLNVQRLFASELWALSSGDEFKAAIALWGRAWQQNPPGSLPNDDRILASFSGAGRTWRKVRAMALRGFVECSDGRLYHRVLCEDVKEAHRKRQAFRERTKNATEARRQRNVDRDDGRDVDRNDAVDRDVTSVQGQGQGQGQSSLRSDGARDRLAPDKIAERLFEAAGGNVDRTSPATEVVGPICDLISLGCDFERHILPTVRRCVPPLDRPLRTWGARWLRDEILAAKAAEPAPTKQEGPRIDFGNGYSAPYGSIRNLWSKGNWLVEWGPKPDEPGFRIKPEVMAAIMGERVDA